MSSDSALSIDSGLSPEQAPAANHLDPSVRRRRVKSHTSWRIIPQIDQDPRLITYVQTLPGRILLFICFTVVLHALGGDPLVAALAATCAYADRYRRYLIASATSMVLYRHGFWIDTGLVALVADQEDVAARINQPMLLSGMLVLVLLLSCSLLHFWRRIITVPLFRRSTLCLVSCFLGLILLAQSPISSGLPRVLLWSFLV